MTMLEERIRTGLAAEARAWPDPAAPGTKRPSTTKGPRVALIAAAVVFAVIGGVAVASRVGTSDVLVTDDLIDPASAGEPKASDTAAPGIDASEAIAEHPVTLSDGTELTISLPVAEGSDLRVAWHAGLSRGAYDESYAAAPFSALVHIWLNRNADDVEQEIEEAQATAEQALEEADAASPSVLQTDNRHIIDHDGHAYDFQFDGSTGTDVPPAILDQWLADINVEQRPDSIYPIVTVSDEYEVTYGPQHYIEGSDVDGAPVVVGIAEGCDLGPGVPVEQASDTRALITSCVLDGRVGLLISGSPAYVERIRELDVVRLAANP